MSSRAHHQVILLIALLSALPSYAQIDSVMYEDGSLLVGEIKSMDKSLLLIETNYSDDTDFITDWKKVIWIRTQSKFLVTDIKLNKHHGTLHSIKNYSALMITDDSVKTLIIQDIVNLNQYDDTFQKRLSAEVDLGFDLTKANNLRSISMTSAISYKTEMWISDFYFSYLRSNQDSVASIERIESMIDHKQVFLKKMYAGLAFNILSNTEQQLDLRLNSQLVLGRFLVKSNTSYMSVIAGANRNQEKYIGEVDYATSWEGLLGTELNLYDIGDFKLLVILHAYPSFTQARRLRSDSKLEIKYDLPLDFYIKLSGSINYDNQPQEGSSKSDYVIQSGFGWEW